MEIYLDSAATTKVSEKVADEVSRVFKEEYGNPSSIHKKGIEADALMTESRKSIGKSINAGPDEIFFNSCATEGNNQVLRNFKNGHIISSEGEHPSVRVTLLEMEKEGTEVTFLPLDSMGRITPGDFKKALRKDTSLVSFMMVNNETGVINPIHEIAGILKEENSRAKFHSDIVQGYMKLPVDVKKMGLDFATISFHKAQGPKGIGALYIRKSLKLNPILTGGSQEGRMRAGTHNVPYISAVGLLPEILEDKINENFEKTMKIRKKFTDFFETVPGYKYNGPDSDYSPYILNVSFKGCPSQVMLNLLSEKGVYVSTGSACSQKNMKDSHVLTSMGLSKDELSSSVRISFSQTTSEKEAEEAVKIFSEALKFFGK